MSQFSELNLGEKLSLAGAVGLLISTFLPWYKIEGGFGSFIDALSEQGVGRGSSVSAWQSLGWLDVILLVAIVVTFVAVFLIATERDTGFRITAPQLIISAGGLALLITTLALIFKPVVFDVECSRQFGVFVAFFFASLMTYGGYASLADGGVGILKNVHRRLPNNILSPSASKGGGKANKAANKSGQAFCTECGKPVTKTAKFCTSCGKPRKGS